LDIEHRIFAFISKNWQGVPIESTSVIVNLIGSTTTQKGLLIRCVLDEKICEKEICVTDEEFAAIHILNDAFRGDWNYTICRNKE
ncbi:MAG: ISAzo13 family transposase, partial [Synergistaceae bacterium]|nr:ISAzo13 family transposase [Synergistaceae bacterium]